MSTDRYLLYWNTTEKGASHERYQTALKKILTGHGRAARFYSNRTKKSRIAARKSYLIKNCARRLKSDKLLFQNEKMNNQSNNRERQFKY